MIEKFRFNYLNEKYIVYSSRNNNENIFILNKDIYYRFWIINNKYATAWDKFYAYISEFKFIILLRDNGNYVKFTMEPPDFSHIEIDKVEELKNIKDIVSILE